MDRRTPHRTRLASGVVLIGLLATGCGNNGVPSGGAVVKPADGSSASTTTTTKPSAGTKVTGGRSVNATDLFTKSYAAALKAGSAHTSMRMGGAQQSTMQGVVSYRAGNPSMQMTMVNPQAGGRIEMRFVDKVMYLQIPHVVPAGKFIAIDPRDTSSPLSKVFGSYVDQMDPMKSLESLKGSITSLRATGTETIDGAPTTRYHVVVDTAKVLAQLKTPVPQTGQNMPATVGYDLWLDSKYLMRRMSFDLGTTSMQMNLTQWGSPVHVTKPPAGAIVTQPGA